MVHGGGGGDDDAVDTGITPDLIDISDKGHVVLAGGGLTAVYIVIPNTDQLDIGVIEGFLGVVFGVHMPKTEDDNTNHLRSLSLYALRRLYTLMKYEEGRIMPANSFAAIRP